MTPDIPKFECTDFRKWDSFAGVIKRAHAAGIEVYAWVQDAQLREPNGSALVGTLPRYALETTRD